MAELNEEQLLLLSNLMYYNGSANKNETVGEIVNEMVADARAGKTSKFAGGFESSPENIEKIAAAIQNDPELSNLIVVDSINEEGARASCFVNETGEATIAIEGTGGTYHAWSDNFQGAYQSDTTDQRAVAEFVNRQTDAYTDITVTGHSKGGNLAQYATVVCGDNIDRCVSFDGQGFSDEFLRKYDSEIQVNSGKIKSISAEGDYVNILLASIAGETVYLETSNSDFINNHSPYYLWEKNTGKMENGEFSETVEQSNCSKALDFLADKLIQTIDTQNPFTELIIMNLLGFIVAGLMSGDFKDGIVEDILNHIIDIFDDAIHDSSFMKNLPFWNPGWNIVEQYTYWKNEIIQAYRKYVNDHMKNQSTLANGHMFTGDTEMFDLVISNLDQCAEQLSTICDSIDNVRLDGALKLLFSYKLKSYGGAIRTEANNMINLQNGLKNINEVYTNTENTNMQVG